MNLADRPGSTFVRSFESLLAGISSRFVRAPFGEMDAALVDALAQVSEFLGVERSHVYLLDPERQIMNEIAYWAAAGPVADDDPLRAIPLSALPFFSDQMFSRRQITVGGLDEMPETAHEDRAFVSSLGVQSFLVVPLIASGETIGGMALTTLTRRRSWNEAEISQLRVLADVFAAAELRRESEREQQESVRFARLITSLVAEFMNLRADRLDEGVTRAVATIARFVDCDRGAIYILEESGDFASLYRGWWAPGATPVVASYERVETGADSSYGEWIRSQRPHLVLNAREIAAIRPDAATVIRSSGLGTVANLRLEIAGRTIGWFGIGAKVPRVGWNPSEIRSLGLAANALANMYSRRQAEIERRRHQRFEDTLSELAADFIKRPLSRIRKGIEEIIDRFGRFAGSDRAAVLLIDEKDQTASTYYEWIGRGVPAPVRGFAVRDAPWFYRQLTTSRQPWFMYIEEFPESDAPAASALEAIGVRTLLNCPLADGENVFGYASIGYAQSRYRPGAGTEQILAVAAGIIANALTRERLAHRAAAQREALARALRLGSLGQLATGIAHELNQPLTAISSYSRACVRRLANGEVERSELVEILGRVSDEAIRAGEIIHTLRNQVRGGPKKRTSAPLREIIESACSLLAGTARDQQVRIAVDYSGDLPPVQVEPTEITQVVINVVQNAIDSIVAAQAERREVNIDARCSRDSVEVEIRDSGPGFAQGDQKRVFDEFYSAKPGGLGLGLSISRSLIEANGGSMEAVAAAGGGVIRFRVPTVPKLRARAPEETAIPALADSGRRRGQP